MQIAEERDITTICIGKPHLNLVPGDPAGQLYLTSCLKKIAATETDLVILS
jgi:two-component system sensor histidine kinase KdpD